MWIEIGNLRSRVARSTDEERRWLGRALAFERKHYGAAQGTARTSFLNPLDLSFPTGLRSHVARAAREDGVELEWVDRRARPCEPDPAADLGWLRDYQLAAVDAFTRATRGILKIPTGGGKTEIFLGLARRLPCRWLFLAHRAQLALQAAERHALRGGDPAEVGVVAEGRWEAGRRLTFATYQSVAAALRSGDPRADALLRSAEGLVAEEAHTVAAGTFWRVAMRTENAYWRLGISGTPLDRDDQRSVYTVAALGRTVYELPSKTLIDAGVLARPTIRVVPVRERCDKPTWQGVYGEAVVRSAERNRAVEWAALRAVKPCLLFVKQVNHGQALCKRLERAGLPCEFVWGDGSAEARAAAIRRLVRGETEVLVCSVVFQEGVDVPALRSVIVASAGKSIIAVLQRVGRGMRRAEGKSEFDVFDFDDRGCPCSDAGGHRGCRWLRRHSRRRLRTYAREGFEVVQEAAAFGGRKEEA